MPKPSNQDVEQGAFRTFAKKRLSLSLLFILPAVIALFAFSSGFVALDILDHFFLEKNKPYVPLEWEFVSKILGLIKLEVLLFTVLGIGAGIGVAYAIIKPMNRIMESAKQIAQGDFKAQLNIDELGEFQPLGKEINRMVSSVNRYMVDSMTGAWIMMDPLGKILSLNTGAMSLLGGNLEEFIGLSVNNLLERSVFRGELGTLVKETVENGQIYSGKEVIVSDLNENKIKYSLSTKVFKGEQDETTGIVLAIRDLTREREVQEHIQRTGELASLGGMAAGLAHEIRNPLGTIKGLTQLLEEEAAEDTKSKKYVKTIIKEVDRLNRVVTDLLQFAQPTSKEFLFYDVNILLENALQLCRIDLERKKAKISKEFENDLPHIWADEGKLIQVFLNLLLNAGEAMDASKAIKIITYFDPTGFVTSSGQNLGAVKIKIMNTGPEIDPGIRSRIFDPFFTTRTEGTGLGLAIVSQIIASHKGSISAEREGSYTVFQVTLPVLMESDTSEFTEKQVKNRKPEGEAHEFA
jgi:two-component system, NtrC family, nitrogen regulation sensor histidine kinase GlnL